MIRLALTVGSTEFWVLVLLAIVVAVYLWYLERKVRVSKADVLQQTYKTLTAEQMASIPDDELLQAVIANTMAKQDEKRPDPYFDLPFLSPERASVYRVWLTCREAEDGGFHKLFSAKTRLITEAAVEDLLVIGAAECGEALKAAFAENADLAAAETAFAAACEHEQPLSLAVTYIRDNTAAFTDEE